MGSSKGSTLPKFIEWQGKRLHIRAWAQELGVSAGTLYSRFERGWSIEEVFTTPFTRYKDITGQVFGKLTALENVGISSCGKVLWRCSCSCGKEVIIISGNLVHGGAKSCGCGKVEAVEKRLLIHGHGRERSQTKTYRVWAGMKSRCNNKNAANYVDYGGRGIKVSERWQDFSNFLEDMGEIPEGKSLERLNVNGDYCLENCCWLSQKEQGRNTRRNHFLIHNNEKRCVSEWAELLSISEATIRTRLKLGWSVEKTLTTAVDCRSKLITYQGKTQSIIAWAEELNLKYSTLRSRLNKGIAVEIALNKPTHAVIPQD